MIRDFKIFESISSTTSVDDLVKQFKEIEDLYSFHINNYGNSGSDSNLEKESSRMMNELETKRRELHKILFKDNPDDDMYDEVHDSILDVGNDMPSGYKVTIVDSYYDIYIGRNHTIGRVESSNGNVFFIDVPTFRRVKLGTIYE